jgi:hypothetical protein
MGEDNNWRDEAAEVLETVARDGLPGPRDLDVALDAIGCAVEAQIASALKWRETINNRLTSWMAPIKDGEEPHDALLRLLEFEQRAFNDPAVSDSAAYLVAETKRDALREAADLCDQLSEHTPGICAIAIREMADEVERDCP